MASTVEENVCDTHDQVVDDASGGDQVDEPAQNNIRTIADLQERQAREHHDDAEAYNRYTALGAVAKSLGCSAFKGESVQTAGGAECVSVTSAEDRGDQESADDMRQAGDTHIGHGDNVRRGSSSAGSALLTSDDASQGRVAGAEDDADSQCTAHEEDAESPVDGLEGILDVDARAPGLGSDHGDVFGTSDAE